MAQHHPMRARLGDFLYGAGCTIAVLSLGAVALIMYVPSHDFGTFTRWYAETGIAAWPIGAGLRILLKRGYRRPKSAPLLPGGKPEEP